MSGPYSVHADNVIAPDAGNVHVFSSTVTARVLTLTASTVLGTLQLSRGPYLTIQPMGGDLYFYTSDSATATTTPGAGVSNKCFPVKDGVAFHFRLRRGSTGWKTRVHHAASVAGVNVHVYISSALTSNDDGNETA